MVIWEKDTPILFYSWPYISAKFSAEFLFFDATIILSAQKTLSELHMSFFLVFLPITILTIWIFGKKKMDKNCGIWPHIDPKRACVCSKVFHFVRYVGLETFQLISRILGINWRSKEDKNHLTRKRPLILNLVKCTQEFGCT